MHSPLFQKRGWKQRSLVYKRFAAPRPEQKIVAARLGHRPHGRAAAEFLRVLEERFRQNKGRG